MDPTGVVTASRGILVEVAPVEQVDQTITLSSTNSTNSTAAAVSMGSPVVGMGTTSVAGISGQFSLVELGKRLLSSARDGDDEDVRLLILKGAPFTTDWLGTSPLHLAAQWGHVGTCKVLMKAGMHRDSRTKVEKTPLHVAAQEGHAEVCELLILYGAKVDALDMVRMTPLHWAVDRIHLDVVEVLLKHGADITLQSRFCLSPAEIANKKNRPDLCEMLSNFEEYRAQCPKVRKEAEARTLAATQSIMQTEEDDSVIEPSQNPHIKPGGISQSQQQGADGLKVLEAHGITLLPEESGSGALEKSMSASGVTLTEAGKMMLSMKKGATSSSVKRTTKPIPVLATSKAIPRYCPPGNSKLPASHSAGTTTRIIKISTPGPAGKSRVKLASAVNLLKTTGQSKGTKIYKLTKQIRDPNTKCPGVLASGGGTVTLARASPSPIITTAKANSHPNVKIIRVNSSHPKPINGGVAKTPAVAAPAVPTRILGTTASPRDSGSNPVIKASPVSSSAQSTVSTQEQKEAPKEEESSQVLEEKVLSIKREMEEVKRNIDELRMKLSAAEKELEARRSRGNEWKNSD